MSKVEIVNADCLSAFDLIPSNSVDCVVTSPPYWGLRSYGDIGGMIGLEPSLAEHLDALVAVFREVRRVLKPTGTCWINYGDAYACAPNGRSAAATKALGEDDRTFRDKPLNTVQGSLKPKDRMMLPARLAIALQEDGWWLRDEIVWHKPNPMPSSVKDRTTPAHEMIYLLTKRPRYYFDQEAMKEPGAYPAGTKGGKGSAERAALPGVNARPPEYKVYSGYRNKRSVWTVPPRPFKEAHFATFPPALIEPCILAGCPVGGTVLDPFAGAGTTGLVARQHGRNAILIELNPDYCEIARRRLLKDEHAGNSTPTLSEMTTDATDTGIFA